MNKGKIVAGLADARRTLNEEKGHNLCGEGCDCPLWVRQVEDSLIQAEAAVERGEEGVTDDETSSPE